jgi:hypothetical protein
LKLRQSKGQKWEKEKEKGTNESPFLVRPEAEQKEKLVNASQAAPPLLCRGVPASPGKL